MYYSGRKLLVLGQVADLGEHSAQLHQRLIPVIDASGADLLLAYGDAMKQVAAETKIPSAWFSDMDSYVAGIVNEFSDHSLILMKGSVSGSDYHRVSGRLLRLLDTEKVIESI